MAAPELVLHPGDRFRLAEDGSVHRALKVNPDRNDPEMLYVTTDLGELPMWISVDDVEEILI